MTGSVVFHILCAHHERCLGGTSVESDGNVWLMSTDRISHSGSVDEVFTASRSRATASLFLGVIEPPAVYVVLKRLGVVTDDFGSERFMKLGIVDLTSVEVLHKFDPATD